MRDLIKVDAQNRHFVTSLDAAAFYERPHKSVLGNIRFNLKTERFPASWFEESTYASGNRTWPMFIMGKEGLVLLASTFTGPLANQTTLAFIQAFAELEAAAHSVPPPVIKPRAPVIVPTVQAYPAVPAMSGAVMRETRKMLEFLGGLGVGTNALHSAASSMLSNFGVDLPPPVLESKLTTISEIGRKYGISGRALAIHPQVKALRGDQNYGDYVLTTVNGQQVSHWKWNDDGVEAINRIMTNVLV